MIPERRYYSDLLCRIIILNSGKIEVKADGDLKIKVRFDDGTIENREYNLEYLRQYVDQTFDPEDWVLGEYDIRSINYSSGIKWTYRHVSKKQFASTEKYTKNRDRK